MTCTMQKWPTRITIWGRSFDTHGPAAAAQTTPTVIVADHGDGLGDHGFFGHAFVAYEELVHVPLILHWPGASPPARVDTPVSTRRVFHTMIDAADLSRARRCVGRGQHTTPQPAPHTERPRPGTTNGI